MIQVRRTNSTIVLASESRGKRLARRIGLSAAAAMLAGTALVPATAQTYDITANNAGGVVNVTDFAGPPLNGPMEITNGLLRLNNPTDVMFGGDLNDSGGLLSFEKRGTGSVLLSGNNMFSGAAGLRVFGGTVVAGSNTALSANTFLRITPGQGSTTAFVDLGGFDNSVTHLLGDAGAVVTNTVGTATLTLSDNTSQSFNGALQGNVGIRKQGTGTVTFTNANPGLVATNTSGPIILENGGLAVGSNNALGTGVLTVDGASTLSSIANVGAVSLGNNIVLNANLTVIPALTTALRLNGDITGAGGLIKTNTGSTLRLAGINSNFAGGTTLQGGRVEVGSDKAFGNGTVTAGNIVLALLNPAVGVTLDNDFVAGATALTLEAGNASTTFGLSGDIAGTRAVILSAAGGPGAVSLSGLNSYTGATRIQGGVLGIGSAGAVAATSQIRFEASGTGIRIDAPGLTIDRNVNSSGAGVISGSIDTANVDAVFSGRLHDSNTNNGDFLALTKTGAGILTVSNASAAAATRNIVSGGFGVDGGTLNLTGRLQNNVSATGGTFAGTGVVGAGTTTIDTGGTLSPGDATIGPNAIGTLTLNNLTLTGTGALRFDLGAPSLDTNAPINDLIVVNGNLNLGGVLNINPLGGFGVGMYRLFTYAGTLSGQLGLGNLPNAFIYDIVAGSGVVDLNVLIPDYYWDGTGPFGGDGVNGGSGDWTPAGTNWTDATGTEIVAWGNQLNVSRAFFQGTAGTVRLTETRIYDQLHFLTDGYIINPEDSGEVLSGLSTTINVADGLTATVNVIVDGGDGLTKIGGGTLNFGNANTYSGGTFLTAGRININNNEGLGFDALIMSANTTLGSYIGQVTVANNITIAGGVTFDSDNYLRLDGVIDGTGGFTKTGPGELVLGVANTFSGDVNVMSGTIGVLNSDALGNANNVLFLSDGTTLSLNPGQTFGYGINVTGNVGITQPLPGTSTLSGNIGGGGAINFTPNGTIILSGMNTFGSSTVTGAGATLQLNNSGAAGAGAITLAGGTLAAGADLILANAIVLNGGGTIATNQFTTQFDNMIGGTGGLTVTNAGGAPFNGVAILANAGNDFTGNLIIGPNATVSVATDGALGAAANDVTINEGRLQSTGSFTTARDITLGGTFGQIDVTGVEQLTVNGQISGSQLRKGDTGTLILNNAGNNFASTLVSGGTLVAGTTGALGAGSVTLANSATLGATTSVDPAVGVTLTNDIILAAGSTATIDSGAGTLTLSGVISEAAAGLGFTKTGAGVLALNGALGNTYTGTTTVQAGTVEAGKNTAFGMGQLALLANTTLRSGANVTLENDIDVTGGVTIDTPELLRLNGDITGSGGITKTGTNGLALAGNNSFTGTFEFTAGQINLFSSNGFGDPGNLVNVAAGTFGITLSNSLNVGNDFTLAGSTDFTVGAGDTAEISGDIGGAAGSINKTDTGTLILSGNNGFGGGTTVAGTLQLNNSNAAGGGPIALNGATLAAGGNLTLANAVTLNGGGTIATNQFTTQFDNTIGGTGGLTVTNVGGAPFNGVAILANANNDFAGGLVIGPNATVSVASNGALGALANGVTINEGRLQSTGTFATTRDITLGGTFGQIDVTGAEVMTVNGLIGGSQLRKGDTGTLIIGNGGNNFASAQVLAGELRVAATNALGNPGGLVQLFNNSTLSGVGTVSIGNDIQIEAGAATTIDSGSGRFTLTGALSGADNLTKIGSGVLGLNGTSPYSGTIQLNAGEIDLEGSIAGGINAASGTRVTGAGTAGGDSTFADGATISPGNSPGTLNFGGNLVISNATNLIWDLDVINTVGMTNDLAIVAGNLTLDGLLQVQPGANFNIGVGNYTLFQYGNLLANNTVSLTNGALPLPAGYNLLTPPAGVTYSVTTTTAPGAATGPGSVLFNVAYNGTYFFDGNGAPIDGIIQGGPGTWNGALTNFTNSDGLFNLAYADSFTQVVQFGAGPGGTTPGDAVSVEGIRQFGTINFTDTGYVLGGIGSLSIDTDANLNVTSGTARINNVIDGTSTVNKGGAGELILGAANTYVGNTNVNNGVLTLAANGASGTGTVNLADTTTLRSVMGTDIAHTNAVSITGTATFDVNSAVFSQDALISGGNLVKTGAGQLQLTTNNTYDNSNIDVGSFRATQNASLGDGIVTMAGGTTGTWSGGQTVGNAFVLTSGVVQLGVEGGSTALTNTVDGAATLEKIGAGRLVLANVANGFGGGSNITAGTLAVQAEGSLGSGNIRFSGAGGRLETLSSFTTAKTVTLDAAGTINTNTNTNRFDGLVSGTGSLSKDGSGRLILTGNNIGFTGDTNLNVGSLQISNGNAIGDANGTPGRLTTQGGTTFVAGLAPGAGTIALSNNITLAGGQTTIDLLGTLLIINPVTGAVSTNGTNLVLDGTITGAGGFTTSNATSGQIVINRTNDFTGNVNLNSVAVVVNSDNALGVNNTVNINQAAGIRNNTGGTTRTIASNIAINDPNATIGGNGNLVLTGAVSGGNTNVFNKVGLGTVTLANAANSIAAQIEVAQGELAVTGTLTDANQLTNVRAGATLSGTGTINGIVEVVNAGVLSAGIGGNGQVGQLTIGTLLLNEQSSLVFDLGDGYVNGGPLNDKIVTTNLRLGGRLTVRESAGGSFGLGVYNLITYQGALMAGSNNVFVQSLPGAFTGTVQTLVPGQVNLVVTQPGTFIQYWDGGDGVGNGVISGGNGTWSALGSNWTGQLDNDPLTPEAQLNTNWVNGSVAVFTGAAGTVTLGQTFNAQGLQFATSGYELNGGLLDNQSTGVGTGMFVSTDTAVTATINSTLQGDGLLYKQGQGTLALGGNNINFSGGTIVQAGTLQLNVARGAGTGSITLNGNTTLANGGGTLSVANAVITQGAGTIDSGAGSFILTGQVSGNGSVIKTGTGNLTLSGNNLYIGGTNLTAGSLTITNNNSIGTGALTTSANTTVFAGLTAGGGSVITLNNMVVLNGATTLNLQGTDGDITPQGALSLDGTTLTLTNSVSGSGPLLVTGFGRLNLNGNNSNYTGATTLNFAAVYVGRDSAFGSGVITLDNGIIGNDSGALRTLTNDIVLAGGGVILGPNDLTLTGVISGAGELTKRTTSTLTLTGDNTYQGGTQLAGGTIEVRSSTALGANISTLFVENIGQTTTLRAGAVDLSLGNGVFLQSGSNLIVDTEGRTFGLAGAINGAGGLTKTDAGNLILSGANDYTGGTALTAGTITVRDNNTALGRATSRLTATGGTSLVAGTSGLNVANVTTLLTGNLTVDSGASPSTLQLSGVIDGVGGITKVNSGTLILSAANGYGGGTNLTDGTIDVRNSNALGQATSRLTATAGTSLVAGVSGLNVANVVTLLAGGNLTVDSSTGTFELSGVIGGAGGITKTNTGNLILSGVNAYDGDTNLTAGSLTVTNSKSIGNGTLRTTGGTTVNAGVNDPAGVAITIGNNVVLGLGDTTFDLQGSSLTFNNDGSIVTDGSSLRLTGNVTGDGRLVTSDFGTLTLSGNNGYTGGTLISSRSVIYVGSDTAVGTGSVTMQAGTGLYNISGATRTLGLTNNFVLNGGSWLGGSSDLVLNGGFTGTGTLIKAGAATLVLNGANGGFTGNSQLRDGRITINTSTALGTGGTLTVFAPVAAPVAGLATTLAAAQTGLVLANNVALSTGSNLIVESGAGVFTLGGVISGDGALTKTQDGTLVLTNAASTYRGGTTLTNGTIAVTQSSTGAPGALTAGPLGTGALAMATGTTLQSGAADLSIGNAIGITGTGTVDTQANIFTLDGVISGGTLSKAGLGTLVLTNATSNYSGGTALTNGTIVVTQSSTGAPGALTSGPLGTGTLTATGGTSLVAGVSGLTIGNAATLLTGFLTVDPGAGASTFELSGVIGGVGGITKVNTGNLILSGVNAYDGDTNLTAGSLTVTNSKSIGNGTLRTTGGTTVNAGVNDPAGVAITIGNNVVLGLGETTFDLQGTSLTFNNDGSIVTDGSSLRLTGNVTGDGRLVTSDFGTLTLSGSNGYTGGTLINSRSVIYVGSDTAVGTGSVTMQAGTGLYNISGATRTLGLTNNFVLNGGSWLGGSSDLVLNGGFTGTGTLIKAGAATLVLNGANGGFTGNSQLRDGRITIDTSTALGTGGTLTVFAPVAAPVAGLATTLAAAQTGLVLANNVALSTGSNLIVESGAGVFTLGGVISGDGALTKTQDGTLVLTNAASTYRGGTTLTNGTIAVTQSSTGAPGALTAGPLGTGALAMATGTTLQSGAADLSIGNAIGITGTGTVDTQANMFALDGVISGGTLSKTGLGTLVLTNAASNYSGGTALTNGTIVVTQSSTGAPGALTSGPLGTGTLTATGGTSLVAGVSGLTIGNAATLLTGSLTVDSGTGTFELSGVIGGVGGITKVNRGNLILSGANDYQGGTGLTAGTITVNTSTALGQATSRLTTTAGTSLVAGVSGLNVDNVVTLLAGGNLTVDSSTGTFELSGVIDGAGGITKTNSGNLILSGVNAYDGDTNLTAGALTVTNSKSIGNGTLRTTGGTTVNAGVNDPAGVAITIGNTVVLGDGATTFDLQGTSLTFNNDGSIVTDGSALTLTGTVTGAGSLVTSDFGTLTLTGANDYAGGTTINARSVVYVGSDTAVGTGTVTMAAATGLYNNSSATRTLTNNFVLNGGSWLGGSSDLVLNGGFTGAGTLIKAGAATLVLNGANSGFTGNSQLRDGRITIDSSTALGTGGTLTVFAPVATPAAGRATTLAAARTGLALANNVVLSTGSNLIVESTSGIFTLDGVISGDGALTKTQAGILVLNGANDYRGGTALNAGTIRAGNSLALGTGALTAAAGTILQAGNAGVTLANNIAMAGGMTVDVFGRVITLGGVISGTGPLSVIDTAAAVGDALVLAGVNTYTGGTVVTGTTVQVSQDANLGNVSGGITLIGGALRTTASFTTARSITLGAGGGSLLVDVGTQLTVNGVISGTSLTKNSGELVLNAANTYTGGTSLNAGTITVGNNAALGTGALAMADGTTLNSKVNAGVNINTQTVALANTISTAGVGTVNVDTGLTLILGGTVSGAGSINKTGAGLLVLGVQNSYAGGTTLVGGTIRTGAGTSLSTGRLTTTGGTTLQAGNADLTVANAITLGTGTTTVDTQAFTYTLSGVASGAGGVSKIGSGVLNLTGASTYTGATTVAAGTLNVTGSLVSAVTVNSGAAITGTGTVGALSVLAGASVNPAAPGTTNVGTLTVTGAASLAGTYTVNVTPSGTDRITAGGALTLGGTLAVVPGASPIFSQFNASFTVASGATRTGTFATVTGLDQFGIAFNPVVDYTATQANIRLAPQSLVTLGNRFGGISGNALEVANAFDRAVAGGYNPQAFFNVYANAGSALPQTLRQLSGEQRATERRVVLDSNRVVRESALDRLNGGLASLGGQQVSSSDGDRTLTFWLRGAGSWGKSRTSGAATAFTAEQRGVITGIDWAKGGLTVGGAFNYTSTKVEYQVLGGSSNVETVGGTVYAGYRQDGGVVANGGVSVAGARANGSRAISLPSFAQSLAGTTTGTTYQVFGELAWDLAAAADTRIEPFARFTYVKADMGRLTETGGVAALTATKQAYDITVTNLGARFGGNVADGKVALSAAASWQNTGGDRSAATVIGIPAVGQNGLIRSVQMDRDALSLQADVGVNVSDTIRFSLGYSGLIGKSNDDHGGRATLNFAF